MKLDILDVTKSIKGTEVLRGVSAEVESGHVLGLAGVNGSGKTMLMRAICGLIHVDSGTISIDGKVVGRDLDFPPSLGMLIERPAFLDGWTGAQNLEALISIRGVSDTGVVPACLQRVGLDPRDRRKYRKYSLGMKQRLGLAAAVVERPALLVLDEPTNALDREGVKMLKGLVHDERDRGAAIVMSCHDMAILEELADSIVYLAEGHVDDMRVRHEFVEGGEE